MEQDLAEIVTSSITDRNLFPIWEKVRSGERLDIEDGKKLYRTDDLTGLGQIAHWVQYQKSGDAVYFVVNRQVNPTNICVLTCKFCDFAALPGDPRGYEMSLEEILSKLSDELDEVHIVGGLHPKWQWDYYLEMMRSIKERFPKIEIKAWTAVEIDFFARKFKLSYEEVLLQLKEAGLTTLPGGGAEVFSERVKRELFKQKIGSDKWLAVHRTAHNLGIRSNATMLYGHIETIEERLQHMILLRELQDETGGFYSFIPLALQPGNGAIKKGFTSAVDDLKTIAVSRLMLDNFPHIKAYWIMLSEEVAPIALRFGADDMDGTVGEERIAHAAGATSPVQLARNHIAKMIQSAGKVPVQRDIHYNPLSVLGQNVIGKIPYLNTLPFFSRYRDPELKHIPATPRKLGELCRKGEICAGAVSLMDFFALEDRFEMLDYCIAVKREAMSVLLFSRYPLPDLDEKMVSITNQTSTAVRLLKTLCEGKYHISPRFLSEPLSENRDVAARLLIGDDALRAKQTGLEGFPFVIDLGEEWFTWQNLPFVFAVWAVDGSLDPSLKKRISATLERNLQTERKVLSHYTLELGIDSTQIETYLDGFIFRQTEQTRESIARFRTLLSQTEKLFEVELV